jgi:hypothetical protein
MIYNVDIRSIYANIMAIKRNCALFSIINYILAIRIKNDR